ncbi:DNA-binding response regulator [Rhizocola hellebori]|uniref:Sensory transduction protein RegX3 n=1 Tax=Rhizocola hellebori TaxID=1392758 RepID=A0A8J3QB27_9ACTN|nr:response regulator transcription factor [Rhizocola hellebori]GIH06487.1 DNA-binding response regulator [Rhizocola hellebori]
MRILLVEDDHRFATALTVALRRAGYEVEHAPTVAAALAASACDLVLLDLGLPDGDGMDLCRSIREQSDVGVIILTARGQERDTVTGLRCGADDYVVKPFGFAELQARMEAVLRRARSRPSGLRVVGKLRVDLDRHSVHLGSEPITLTRKEFQLLAILAAEPEVAVRRDRLFAEVWHTSWQGTSRTLDAHMTALRSKIGAGAEIQTIRGVGYRIVAGG